MPNVNEFITYCSNLGIDHIEVLDDVTYESLYHKTGVLSEQYEVVRNMTVINATTYENYQRRLDKENIVFFVRGKVKTSGVNFKGKYIGEIIKEIENRTEEEATAEGEEYWGTEGVKQFLSDLIGGNLILKEDENGTVTLPFSVDTMYIGNAMLYERERGGGDGTPAWTGKIVQNYDISVDCGIRSVQGAIKDNIIAQGLLGIQANNFADLDENQEYRSDSFLGRVQRNVYQLMNNKESLENIAIPWLYTKFGIYPNDTTWNHMTTDFAYGFFDNNLYTQPIITRTSNRAFNDSKYNNFFGDIWESYLNSIDNNQYVYRIRYMSDISNNGGFNKKNFGLKNNYEIIRDLDNYMSLSYQEHPRKAINEQSDFKYTGIMSSGGYDKSKYFVIGKEGRVAFNSYDSDSTIRDQIYNEQPFIIGMVPWIYNVKTENNLYYAQSWVVLVGFKKNGEILMPQIIGNMPAEQGHPSQYITYRWYPGIDFQGHIAFQVALEMTQAEYEYALSKNNLIIPISCLEEGTYILNE